MILSCLPAKKLILLMIVLQIAGAQARPGREPVQEFENDTKIFRNGSIRFAPEGIVHSYLPKDEVLSPSTVTLVSKQFIGEKPTEKDTSDKEAQDIQTAYQIILSFETEPDKVEKIRKHEEYVRFLQQMKPYSTEVAKRIELYKEWGEWGPIITSELQKEKKREVIEFKNLNNQFLLRHTLTYSSELKHVNGTVVLYPGNNWKILEEEFSGSYAPPKWEVGHLQYEIFVDKGILHIIHIGVESLWRSKGIGYAIAQYFTHFCCEHFSQVSDLTVNCRNVYSENIFEKCGFKSSASFKDATHHLSTHSSLGYNFEDGQKLIPAYHRSDRTDYLTWLNENYTKFFPKRLHKTGYRY